MRVPGIAWWPGTVPAGAVDRGVATTMDLYVTALALAGREPPGGRPVDGHDISARLKGEAPQAKAASAGRRPFFYYGPRHELHAVRHGRWKLHVKTSSQTGIDYFDGALPLLFDLEQDPGEKWNLADRYPDVVAGLLVVIDAHRAEVERSGTFFGR
jgi:arylsulfatase